jgi:tetratricopeptide (TPR) repeat protein
VKKLMAVLGFLALPAASLGQELPKATEEGKAAATALIEACKNAGALKTATDPRTKAERIVVADGTKLKEIIHRQRQQFTPALRNGLLPHHEHSGVVTLLLQLGEATGDDQAVAFGRLFAADGLMDQVKYPEARQGYERAVALFERLKMREWQAASLHNLANVCRIMGDLPKAHKLAQQSLDLHKQLYGERHPAVADALNTLAEVCHAQGDLPQARKLHEQALDLYKQLHGERHPDVAQSLNNLVHPG